VKKILAVLLLALAGGAGALALTFRAAVLPVVGDGAIAVPAAQPPAELQIAVLHTGKMFSKAGFAYRGGALGEQRTFGMAGVLVRHPQGLLLIDVGFGRNVDQHVRATPWLMRATSEYEKEVPVADQLRAAGVDAAPLAVVLTHAHWDHISGVEDLPGVPVLVTQAELDFIRSGDPATELARRLGALNYQVYGFPDGPYLGFDASYDVFKDGSVVIVHAAGHTPGSVIVFVTPPGDRRYAFVGDLVWQREGVEIPAERPWLSRRLVDQDEAVVRQRVAHLHRLAQLVPGLVIVPAHDRRVLESLPGLP
jgi:glyoxylase-like metal-dependent hydrolase (beta-lactamase superfamily II)